MPAPTTGRWLFQEHGAWLPVEPSVADALHAARTSGAPTCTFTRGSVVYTVDMGTLCQRNTTTGFTRTLRWEAGVPAVVPAVGAPAAAGAPAPAPALAPAPAPASFPPVEQAEWTQGSELVAVVEGSAEWVRVADLFHATMPPSGHTIARVERVQNEVLWSRYSLERRLMNAQNVVEGANERVLFHGTRNTDPAIVHKGKVGLDPRCTGEQRYYGSGVYFAEGAAYVDSNYAYKSPGKPLERQVILAHVLCGRVFDYGQTLDKGLKRPPYVANSTDIYDSVQGGPHSGSVIRVVYSNAHSYPSYVITYRKQAGMV